ncbi:MAG: hypothetical protein CMJ24_07725 [Phycisphaerae bacterium]|nr:hypothetical protein [Phycisphaerae bacterium]MDG1898421.1 type III pantothenate kinase [Phycisphaerales bacterium]|tara:strand:- start:45 stop:845 length:801 start_codon:yes stop_codon:yes gene_type:complete
MQTAMNMIALNTGNSRTQMGRFVDGSFTDVVSLPNEDLPAIIDQVVTWWTYLPDEHDSPPKAVLIASVDDEVAQRIESTLKDQLSEAPYRLGQDLPIPIAEELDPETLTGADRLLNAAAAWSSAQQACVVVDAGTCITVDFIDGAGTFHGGAIAPGARMQLESMHRNTDALPEIDFVVPDADPFGRSTTQAMLHGVYHGIRGTVRNLIELYAEHYGAWPMVVATGGDAERIFGDDELIDRIVPNLTLMGIANAAKQVLADDEASES